MDADLDILGSKNFIRRNADLRQELANRVMLFCYQFDLTHKKYTIVAMKVMQIGGGARLLLLAAFLVPFWRRQSTKQQGVG